MKLFEKLSSLCQTFEKEFDTIPLNRKQQLETLSKFCIHELKASKIPQLIVICTHNSRRSHIGQLMLALAADYYDVKLATYSGGTEATAFNFRAVNALQTLGFVITTSDSSSTNPIFSSYWLHEQSPYLTFSKKYDSLPNPVSDFAAIMVCTDADENCPLITGTLLRHSLPYEDPKIFDDTPLEQNKYIERCLQIGREMHYMVWLVKQALSKRE